MIIYFLIAGLLSGVVGGMGMGGGTLLIPILTIFLGIEQRLAQGINLIVFVPMSIVTVIIHCKNKLIDFKVGIPIIISGLITSITGSIFATKISNEVLKKLFAIFLLLIGVWQIVSIFLPSKKEEPTNRFKIVGFIKYK